ncbi:MAG TPA: segregation/condensation protein A [Chloroflexota bacterium]|nr:segregation/condensation protein A [Chloroflexota bacterium]
MTARLGDVTLHLGIFDGPLDLLLNLIERRELDITTVSLAQVADSYLSHVRAMEELDPYGLAEFIAVAAKLLLIKSTVLLPRPERGLEAEQPEDPTDLTERLREYQLIKQAATALKEREEAGLRSYWRLAPLKPPPARPRRESGAPNDLLRALQRLAEQLARQPKEEVLEREQFSIGEKIELLRARCARGGRVSLIGLLANVGRGEAVATFLALLELLRLGEVDAVQEGLFGDVVVFGVPRIRR